MGTEREILVACPHEDEAGRAEKILSHAGFRITQVTEGPSVIKYLRRAQTAPAMVVLYTSLEEMPALSCLGWIKSQDEMSAVKTLIVSDETDLHFLRECIDLGLDGYLQTPYTDAQLLKEAKKWSGAPLAAPSPAPAAVIQPATAKPSLDQPHFPAAPGFDDMQPAAIPSPFDDDEFEEDAQDSVVAHLGVSTPTHTLQAHHDEEEEDEDLPQGGSASGDDSTSVGEFDEDDAGDDVSFSTGGGDDNIHLEVSKELAVLLEKRLHIQIEIDHLEKQRKELIKSDEITDAAKAVYDALSRELRRIPTGKEARERLTGLEQKINAFRESASAGERPPAGKDLEQAWSMARKQRKLWMERDALMPEIRKATIPYLREEPLFKLLLKFKFPAEVLFGFAIYVLALEAEQARLQKARKSLQKNINEIDGHSKGLLSAFRRGDDDKKESLSATSGQIVTRLTAISREIEDLEKPMVKEFWRCYELSACLYVSGKVSADKQPLLRLLLRFGLLGHAPYFIAQDVLENLVHSATNDVICEWDRSMSASRIFYPDEYIAFSVSGDMTESIDENLELTMRNSPQWSADKARRRIAFSNLREHALHETMDGLRARITALRGKQDAMESEKENLIRSAKDYKQRKTELAQSVQHCKVEAARLERAIEKIADKHLPDLTERRNMAKEKLRSSGIVLSAFDIARHEVAGIHRVSRLCAKLKDPFLPFLLRDNYKLTTDVINDRQTMLKAIADIETSDKTIFKEVLIPSRKAAQRVYLRFHPTFLLTPSCGFLAYSWNPRVGVEVGRLVFPGYCPRMGLRDRMLANMLADFHWDTSKAAAGVDLLTSDTLVAAYATVRWEYRKKNKINREKALIFNELNDRQNWRRHYELFLQSAQDAGRKLFFKNYEVYEVILKYLGLPDGVDRLRR